MRYQVRVDGGVNPETGQRQQIRRRYLTEAEARRALAGIADQALAGSSPARRSPSSRYAIPAPGVNRPHAGVTPG